MEYEVFLRRPITKQQLNGFDTVKKGYISENEYNNFLSIADSLVGFYTCLSYDYIDFQMYKYNSFLYVDELNFYPPLCSVPYSYYSYKGTNYDLQFPKVVLYHNPQRKNNRKKISNYIKQWPFLLTIYCFEKKNIFYIVMNF